MIVCVDHADDVGIEKPAKPRRKKTASPTARSLAYLRKAGYLCQVVEQTIPHTFIKRDLFGFVDIIAIKGSETLAVQTTANGRGGGFAQRRTKILSSPHLAAVLAAGWRIEVHGWGRPTKTRRTWSLRVVNVGKEEAQ